ncbi:MAG: hypothetical protein LBF12_05340 [Christensenellaceae bacterium]|jgi:hypothetical protein|nr:hypothetical protein [Christensenellaceae bacterium]
MKELIISADKNDVSYSEHFDRFDKYVTSTNPIDYGTSYEKTGPAGIKYAKTTRSIFISSLVFFILSLISQVYNIIALKTNDTGSLADSNPLGIWLYVIEIVLFALTLILYFIFLARNRKSALKMIDDYNDFERQAFLSAQERFSIPDNFDEIGIFESQVKARGAEVVYLSDKKPLLLERRLIYAKDNGVAIADYETEYTLPYEILESHKLIESQINFISFDPSLAESPDVKMYNLTSNKTKYSLGSYGKFVFKDIDGEFELKVLPNDFHKLLRLFIPQDKF